MNYKKYVSTVIFVIIALIIGIGAGYLIGFNYEHGVLVQNLSLIHPLRNHATNYKFSAPLLAYVVPSADQESRLGALKSKISDFIVMQKKTNTISDVSVYFNDLNRGRWIGINEKQKYNPASMLKVVIMVSYFKETESHPEILKQNFIYTDAMDEVIKKDAFNSSSNLKINNSYSAESLIEKMIIDSDNGTEVLLFNNINKDNLDIIYSALNITNPEKVADDFVISPRAYSLFFRIIYSATYLNEALSEKALDILSKTTFKDGITAGLPEDIVVSHKFGEHITNNNNQIQVIELHDCGIVYYPINPYFLCVMTKGNNLDELKSVIKNISSLVYESYGNYK